MSKTTITFRTDAERRDALDALAINQKRNRSFLINEALDNYLDVQRWQIEHIKEAIAAADRGDFVTPDDMEQTFSDLRARCQ